MQIIKQSATVWGEVPCDPTEAISWIARAGRTCFIPGTEILTEEGFKPVETIPDTSLALTFNQAKGLLEYQPANMLVKPYSGEMVVVAGYRAKFVVTPDHRVLLGDRPQSPQSFNFVRAEELKSRLSPSLGGSIPISFPLDTKAEVDLHLKVEMPPYVYVSGRPPRALEVPGLTFTLSDDFLLLVAAYISDGHIGKNRKGVEITKHRDNPLVPLLTSALSRLGIKVTRTKSAGRDHILGLKLHGGRPLGKWFEENCGRGSLNKHLPPWWRRLSVRQKSVLYEFLLLGDGVPELGTYGTSSPRLMEEVTELLILSGQHGNVSVAIPKGGTWTKNVHYTIHRSKRYYAHVTTNNISTIHYSGAVYCPQTENGIVCMRYKGKIVWIGNCYLSEKKGPDDAFVAARLKPDPPHASILEHSNLAVRFGVETSCILLKAARACRWLTVKDDRWGSGQGIIFGNLRAWYELLRPDSVRDIWRLVAGHGAVAKHSATLPREARRVTVELITDRAILAEITRHRDDVGFSVESQRYVNYDGSGITFIEPSWFDDASKAEIRAFRAHCFETESLYLGLRAGGRSPQHARVVLTNQVKTTIVMSAYLPEWDWVFKLRRSKAAYPQMILLMDKVHAQFVEQGLL